MSQDNEKSEKNFDEDEEEEEVEEEEEDKELYENMARKYSIEITHEESNEDTRLDTAEKPDEKDCKKVDYEAELKKRYNPKNTSMKPILVEYGLPEPEPPARVPSPEKQKKKKKKSSYERISSGKNRPPVISRQGTAVENDVYENIYDDLLYKVELQRKEIQQRSEIIAKKLEEDEEKKKPKKKQLERVDLKHDAKFMRDVSKSHTYEVVKAEAELRAKGKLSTHKDFEQFWDAAKDHKAFQEYLNIVNPKNLEQEQSFEQDREGTELTTSTSDLSRSGSGSLRAAVSEKERTNLSEFRPMTEISELKEPSRPQTVDEPLTELRRSKSLTRHFDNLNAQYEIPYSVLKKQERLDPQVIAKLAAAELDRKLPASRCPTLIEPKLPALACFQEISAGPDPSEDMIKYCLAHERKEKKRRLFVHRIRKMYSVAQTNLAATKRMLEKQNEPEFIFGGSSLHSWFPTEDDKFQIAIYESATDLEDKEPWKKYVAHRRIMPIQEEDEMSRQTTFTSLPRNGAKKVLAPIVGSPSTENDIKTEATTKEQALVPLNISDVLTKSDKVMQSKAQSIFWKNFITGRKMQAPSY